jgi:hypothetical protein
MNSIIKSLSEYIDFLRHYDEQVEKKRERNRYDMFLFRGQRNAKHSLVPRIGRPVIGPFRMCLKGKSKRALLEVEETMFDSFSRLGHPYLHNKPEVSLARLAIAQHYGLPTRLLDWTANALAALWFAVKEPAEKKQRGAVWVFNPRDEDFVNEKEESAPFIIKRVAVYRPKSVATRVAAQAGCFTVHSFSKINRRFESLENDSQLGKRIEKIEVHPDAFWDLRDQLERCGVSDLTLYPDLEGVCRFISWNHSFFADEEKHAPDYVALNK